MGNLLSYGNLMRDIVFSGKSNEKALPKYWKGFSLAQDYLNRFDTKSEQFDSFDHTVE